MKNSFKLLAKRLSIPLRLTEEASLKDAAIHEKMFGCFSPSDSPPCMTTLIMMN